jgi:succinyl-CoA synthetase beta subunit
VLPEYEAISLLAACGVPASTGVLARDADEAVAAAGRYGGPVALKVQSPGIPHKTEAGAVALGLATPAAVGDAFATVMANARAFDGRAEIRGVLVQPMAAAGVEMIVGIHFDDDFGPMLMVGLGGILVEVLDDVAFAPVPISRPRAEALVGRLRGATLLGGVRGRAPSDMDALLDLLVALSHFAAAHSERLAAVDLNPVIVHPRGEGLTIVDALIVKREAGTNRENGGESSSDEC